MSVEFSAKISMLRKEKGVTQRKAAQELGVSQALLSHYEKGIRECNLDFVKRAAAYYSVSSDYLLGITESKQGMTDLYALGNIESDDELTPKTLIRAMLFLSSRLAQTDETEAHFFVDFFSLAAQKYTALISGDAAQRLKLNDLSEEALLEARKQDRRAGTFSDPTAAYRTIIKNAERQIDETAQSLLQ
ncbi:MAG: helix-turn-helix transcriptional regulator [Clostridia bacterium]|nr:helix-turn-helix transcriptional regulator [Clostridia bacterium]MBR5423828.1 helix-turn-helix transcriptional regulator [Clostridia bacterium]